MAQKIDFESTIDNLKEPLDKSIGRFSISSEDYKDMEPQRGAPSTEYMYVFYGATQDGPGG